MNYKYHASFKKNSIGSDYIIGDIHGQYNKLMSQLDSVNFNFNQDRLFCVGDLIDRGSDSVKVVQLLNENWFFSTMGNHEHLMLLSFVDMDFDILEQWNEEQNKWVFNLKPNIYKEILYLIKTLPLHISLENKKGCHIGICHAEPVIDDWNLLYDKCIKLNKDQIFQTLESRGLRLYLKNRKNKVIKNIDHIFMGHSPISEVEIYDQFNYIDTGSFFENDFTIINIDKLK